MECTYLSAMTMVDLGQSIGLTCLGVAYLLHLYWWHNPDRQCTITRRGGTVRITKDDLDRHGTIVMPKVDLPDGFVPPSAAVGTPLPAEDFRAELERYRKLVRGKDPETMEKRRIAALCPTCGEHLVDGGHR